MQAPKFRCSSHAAAHRAQRMSHAPHGSLTLPLPPRRGASTACVATETGVIRSHSVTLITVVSLLRGRSCCCASPARAWRWRGRPGLGSARGSADQYRVPRVRVSRPTPLRSACRDKWSVAGTLQSRRFIQCALGDPAARRTPPLRHRRSASRLWRRPSRCSAQLSAPPTRRSSDADARAWATSS